MTAQPTGALTSEWGTSMNTRRNMLIGIVVGIVIVAALTYATGLSKQLLATFGSSAEYKSSESATAPELGTGDWINSEPLSAPNKTAAQVEVASHGIESKERLRRHRFLRRR
jgi:hypothetical protein